MAKPRTTRRRNDATERKPKKKISILVSEQVTWIDYKDVNLLRRFMSERAKIRARRVTGNTTQQQREVARAIRVAREMALLPYNVRQVTHRSKRSRDRDGEGGGRGRRDGYERRDRGEDNDAGLAESAITGIEHDIEIAEEIPELAVVSEPGGDE